MLLDQLINKLSVKARACLTQETETNNTMSFSRTTKYETKNPCVRYYEWREGVFSYYDKESKKRIEVDEDEIKFIVLEMDLFTIKGFDEGKNVGFFSNEVRTINDELVVKYSNQKKELFAKGTYSELKEKLKAAGAKFARSVYVLMDGEICHFAFLGSSLGGWGDCIEKKCSASQLREHYVILTGKTQKKRGSVKYEEPVFELGEKLSKSDAAKAVEADTLLQDYLDVYLEKGGQVEEKESSDLLDEELNDGHSGKSHDEATEEVDTEEWRTYVIENKKVRKNFSAAKSMLCESSEELLNEYKEHLENLGEEESVDYAMVCRGIFEWQKGRKGWRKLKGRTGTLGDATKEDVIRTMKQMQAKDGYQQGEYYIPMVCAYEYYMENDASEDEDEDDIPF